jgi:hypothetical protein
MSVERTRLIQLVGGERGVAGWMYQDGMPATRVGEKVYAADVGWQPRLAALEVSAVIDGGFSRCAAMRRAC